MSVSTASRPASKFSPRLIYEGATIRVLDATDPEDDSTVVVTFPDRSVDRGGFRRPAFGGRFLESRNISAVLFQTSWAHWFQVPETEAALEAARSVTRRFRRVVTYGSSMGGYAAAATSRALDASAILALAPQYSIDRKVMPAERRWRVDFEKISAHGGFGRDHMPDLLRPEAALHITFDPRTMDAAHAARLMALSQRPRPLIMPFGGHNTAAFLLETKLLTAYVLSVIRDEVAELADFRRRIRAARPDAPTWWTYLAQAARQRHPELSLTAAKRATSMAPNDHLAFDVLGATLTATQRHDEAAAAYGAVVELRPGHGVYRLRYAAALQAANRPSEAEAQYRTAIELNPQNFRGYAGLAEAQLAQGDDRSAEESLAKASALGLPATRFGQIRKRIAAFAKQSRSAPAAAPA